MNKEYKDVKMLTINGGATINYDSLVRLFDGEASGNEYYCEISTGGRMPNESVGEWIRRSMSVDPANICGSVSCLRIIRNEEGNDIVIGDIKITGPKGRYLDEILQGENPDNNFYIRGTSLEERLEDVEKPAKEINKIIAFTLV